MVFGAFSGPFPIPSYVDWDDDYFYLITSNEDVLKIANQNLKVSADSRQDFGKIQTSFVFEDRTQKGQYRFSFTGSKCTAVLGISPDFKDHAKQFTIFVATKLPNPPKNFRKDGTYNHTASNILFFGAIIVFVLVVIFLKLFVKI